MKKTGKLLILLLILSICLTISNFVLAQDQEIELKLSHAGYPEQTMKFFREFEKEYLKEHPNVKFKYIEGDIATFHDRIAVWLRGGMEPDVYWFSLTEYINFKDLGVFLPLDDLIDEKLKKAIPEDLLNLFRGDDGKLYAIPGGASPVSFWYNKEIFKEAGLDPDKPPKDWNELVDYAQKIIENTDAYGIGLSLGRPEDLFQLVSGNIYFSATNEQYLDPTGRPLFNSPEGIKAFQFIVDMVNKYKVTQPYPEQYTKGDLRVLFKEGKLAMMFDGPWIIKYLKEFTDMSSRESSKFVIGDPPASTIEGKKAMVAGGCDPWVISSRTKYPEEAKDVLRELLKPEWQYKRDVALDLNPFRNDVMEEYEFELQWVWDAMLKDRDRIVMFNAVLTSEAPPGALGQVKIIILDNLVKAVVGGISVEEAINKAAEEVNDLFGR